MDEDGTECPFCGSHRISWLPEFRYYTCETCCKNWAYEGVENPIDEEIGYDRLEALARPLHPTEQE